MQFHRNSDRPYRDRATIHCSDGAHDPTTGHENLRGIFAECNAIHHDSEMGSTCCPANKGHQDENQFPHLGSHHGMGLLGRFNHSNAIAILTGTSHSEVIAAWVAHAVGGGIPSAGARGAEERVANARPYATIVPN
nr:hypothetical protein [uncultured bacterium]